MSLNENKENKNESNENYGSSHGSRMGHYPSSGKYGCHCFTIWWYAVSVGVIIKASEKAEKLNLAGRNSQVRQWASAIYEDALYGRGDVYQLAHFFFFLS